MSATAPLRLLTHVDRERRLVGYRRLAEAVCGRPLIRARLAAVASVDAARSHQEGHECWLPCAVGAALWETADADGLRFLRMCAEIREGRQ